MRGHAGYRGPDPGGGSWPWPTSHARPAVNVQIVSQEDFDSEQMSAMSSCLAELFKDHFRGDLLPEEITEE